MTFTELRNNLNQFNAEAIVTDVYDATKELLADLNTEQLRAGQTVEGGAFQRYRMEEYADFKVRINPLPGYGNPDLKLTGEFHSSIIAEVSGGKLQIRSTLNDEKVNNLERWYGPQSIYGLNDENRIKHVEENIVPEFKDRIEKVTGLTMQE